MKTSTLIKTFERDLSIKKYAESTTKNYVSQINMFLNYFKHKDSPKHISSDEIKDYLLTAKEVNSQCHMHSAIKLFYKHTIHQPQKFRFIEYPRKEKKIPVVFSKEEVQAMFSVCTNKKHITILSLLYSCGFRVSELLNLKWSDIDRKNGVIRVFQGKGNKDRIVPLNDILLKVLEDYYKLYKSKEYVLNGQFDLQYSSRSVANVLNQLATKAGIKKRIYPHLMRHNCFTHMHESGIDILRIKEIAGHKSLKTTMVYQHIGTQRISSTTTPLNFINL